MAFPNAESGKAARPARAFGSFGRLHSRPNRTYVFYNPVLLATLQVFYFPKSIIVSTGSPHGFTLTWNTTSSSWTGVSGSEDPGPRTVIVSIR